jgi:hypothetical protein
MADRARHGRDNHGGKDRHRSEARGHQLAGTCPASLRPGNPRAAAPGLRFPVPGRIGKRGISRFPIPGRIGKSPVFREKNGKRGGDFPIPDSGVTSINAVGSE